MRRLAALALVAACGGGELDTERAPRGAPPSPPMSGVADCALAHATSSRHGASCALLACDDGFSDCNGDAADGCEASLLADAESCGACGNVCARCDRGACGSLVDVAPDAHARELVANGGTLAWLDDGRLRVAEGGAVATWATGLSASAGANEAGAIALGDGFAIVADVDGKRLVRASPTSTSELALGAFASVALRGGDVYALRLAAGSPGAIVRVALGGGAPIELVSGLDLASACRIAVDASWVWWTDPSAEIVWRVPLAGGPAEPWARRQRMTCGVVVDATRAHWIAVDPTLAVFVVRVLKSETPDADWIQTATELGHYEPTKLGWDLALGGGVVAFANRHDGTLWSVAPDTGAARLIAGAQPVRGVAAGASIAWGTPRGVVRIAP